MNNRGRWIGAAAWFAVWWGLATVVFRLVGLVIDDLKSWTTCAGMAAASIATGELSERWHRRRRKTKSRTPPSTVPETGCTTSAPDPAGNSGEQRGITVKATVYGDAATQPFTQVSALTGYK